MTSAVFIIKDRGEIELELDRNAAPEVTAAFLTSLQNHYYDGRCKFSAGYKPDEIAIYLESPVWCEHTIQPPGFSGLPPRTYIGYSYAILGKVILGASIIENIGKPITSIVVESASLKKQTSECGSFVP